jgi:ATP-dependent RNA helicase DeaD
MSDTLPPERATGFAALGLKARLVDTLTGLGYQEPTPIQREAIPPLLEGRDLIGQAATGTGKTAAFTLPLLQRLVAAGKERARPSVLILVPTRELAMQVAEAVHRYGKALGIQALPVYGGQPMDPQVRALKRGVDVVIATPGRAHDHVRRGTLRLSGVSAVVLDEADEMLDMGFADDMEAILAETPKPRQTMLFSATLAPNIAAIARRHLTNAIELRVAKERMEAGQGPRVRQTAYIVARAHKRAALGRLLDIEIPTAALVFCRTRTEVDELTETLRTQGYRPEALHGGMSQEQRDRVMRLFRAGTTNLLIATDVAARGLDVEQLSHVVNFHVPDDAESYVHRIGRVGRAGREGVAITLAEPREHHVLRTIERATGQKIEVRKVPTVADLQAKRLGVTQAALREALLEGGLEEFRAVVSSLAGEFDIMDVALAAVKLTHQAGRERDPDSDEIPSPEVHRESRGHGGKGRKCRDQTPAHRGPSAGTARVFIGAGRALGVRPGDLVGAIANEAGVDGRDITILGIGDRHSIVEVPEEAAEYVIECLSDTRIKGRKVTVRPDHMDQWNGRARACAGRGVRG